MGTTCHTLHSADKLTSEHRRYTMRQVHGENTKPEIKVRRLAHRMGFRFRLHRKDLPGKPEFVFPKRRKIIFVHGCFWHGHDCQSGRKRPVANQQYWLSKLERNKIRDVHNQAKLRELGWDVLVVWECEIKNLDRLSANLSTFLESASL